MIKTKRLLETKISKESPFSDVIPDDPIFNKNQRRAYEIGALLDEAKKVRKQAEAKGMTDVVAELDARIKQLEELVNDHGRVNISNKNARQNASREMSGEKQNTNQSNSKQSGKPGRDDQSGGEGDDQSSKEDGQNSQKDKGGQGKDQKQKQNGKDDNGNGSDGQDDGKDEKQSNNSKDSKSSNGKQNQNGDDGDDENDSNNSSSGSMENPFSTLPKAYNSTSPAGGLPQVPDESTHEEKVAAVKEILKALRGGEHDGALKALNDYVSGTKTVESLSESMVSDMTDDEYIDLINSTLDIISKVRPVQTLDDPQKRFDELSKKLVDRNFKRQLQNDEEKIKQSTMKINNSKKALPKYKVIRDDAEMQALIEHLIESQIKNIPQEVIKSTWSRFDKKTVHTSVLKPGQKKITKNLKNIPELLMFFDCSGSFNGEDVAREERLASRIQKYADAGQIKITKKYFTSLISDTYYGATTLGGGNGAADEIIEFINSTIAQHRIDGNKGVVNVLLCTDTDEKFENLAIIDGVTIFGWRAMSLENSSALKYIVGSDGYVFDLSDGVKKNKSR